MRKGFALVGLDGQRSILSHVDIKSQFVVGRYGVDVSGFEDFLEAIDLGGSLADIILIDEIGKMECFSQRFKSLLLRRLDSRKIIIATIALKGNEFISQIRKRSDVQVYGITTKNRDSLGFNILSQVENILRQEKVKS